jgi:hypothetical protein
MQELLLNPFFGDFGFFIRRNVYVSADFYRIGGLLGFELEPQPGIK